jgi:hypothetical protein
VFFLDFYLYRTNQASSTKLCGCLTSYVGILIPSLQFLGILFSLFLLADVPISLLGYARAWKYSTLGVIWICVAGTLWWYLLGRAVQAVVLGFTHRNDPPAELIG